MELAIKDTLKYPFKNFKSLWNFWWMLIPLFGWFFISGYSLQILRAIIKGKDEGLPPSDGFWINFIEGLKLIILVIPIYAFLMLISYLMKGHMWLLVVYVILNILISIHFLFAMGTYSMKRKFSNLYDFKNSFSKFKKYWKIALLGLLITLLISIIWLFASVAIVTILVTLPAITFGQYYVIGKINAVAYNTK